MRPFGQFDADATVTRVHVHERSIEPEVIEQELQTTRQGPAEPSSSASHDAVDVLLEGWEEVAALEARLVIGDLRERLEGNAKLVFADDAVQVLKAGRFAV